MPLALLKSHKFIHITREGSYFHGEKRELDNEPFPSHIREVEELHVSITLRGSASSGL